MPLSQLDHDLWSLRVTCAACQLPFDAPARAIWLDASRAPHAFDDALLIAPSPVCPACNAVDRYTFSPQDERALTRLIHEAVSAEGEAPKPFILRQSPLALIPAPDQAPVPVRRASHAIALLQAHADAHPDDPQAWARLGALASGYFAHQAAADAFQRAARLDPANPRHPIERIIQLAHAGHHDQVRTLLPDVLPLIAASRHTAQQLAHYGPRMAALIERYAGHHLALHIQTAPPDGFDDAIAIRDIRFWPLLPDLLSSPDLLAARLIPTSSLPAARAPGPLTTLLTPPAAPPSDQPPAPFIHDAPRAGRNDPCPCGSGKKYKKCHGA